MTTKDITNLKQQMQKNLGKKITLSSRRGRTRASTQTGVIESAHRSIFTVKLDKSAPYDISGGKRVAYSYTDILTRNIEIRLADQA